MNNDLIDDMIRASDYLKKFNKWVLFTHKNADGDTLGSASALFEIGIAAGKNILWFGPDAEFPHAYKFLHNSEKYNAHIDKFYFDDKSALYIFLDCANETRSVNLGEDLILKDFNILNIDHHEDNTCFGSVNCVAPGASSTAELLLLILRIGGWDISLKAAESLYTGMWTDTGGFAFSSTLPRTHRVIADLMELGVDAGEMFDAVNQTKRVSGMALWGRALSRIKIFGDNKNFALSWVDLKDFKETGAVQANTEGLPSCLMALEGVRLAAFISEQVDGAVKISVRSRPGNFGAADIARELGGGGHTRAAGAIIKDKNLNDFIAEIIDMIILKDRENRENLENA